MESLTKQRDILFSSLQAYEGIQERPIFDVNSDMGLQLDAELIGNQAKSAIFLLADVDGVLDLKYLSDTHLLITYDIRILTLDTICQALSSVGFLLDNSLISKIKNALYAYTENTLRENLGIVGSKLTRDVFIQGYQQRLHGCRDQRSHYWRHYL